MYWDKICQPPPGALKTIGAGRLKNFTDVNPQWRIQAMTEVFGPCGIGWKYEIVDQRTYEGPDGQVMAVVDVCLYIRSEVFTTTPTPGTTIQWSHPIPGTGGSMLIAKEKSGLHFSDEAFKMALTDALSVAMKALGMAADIYKGLWDGSKYLAPPPESVAHSKLDKAPSPVPSPEGPHTEPKNDTFTNDDSLKKPSPDEEEKRTNPKYKWDSPEVEELKKRGESHGVQQDLFIYIAQQAGITTWKRGIGKNQLKSLEDQLGLEIIDGTHSKAFLEQQKQEAENA
jgi:hypothetical protein